MKRGDIGSYDLLTLFDLGGQNFMIDVPLWKTLIMTLEKIFFCFKKLTSFENFVEFH